MKIWDKLDEVMGAMMLSSICLYCVHLDFNGNLAAICATGIITLLSVGAVKKNGGDKRDVDEDRCGNGSASA